VVYVQLQLMLCNHHYKVLGNLPRSKNRRRLRVRLYRKREHIYQNHCLSHERKKTRLSIHWDIK
jgi:hypothetical protein